MAMRLNSQTNMRTLTPLLPLFEALMEEAWQGLLAAGGRPNDRDSFEVGWSWFMRYQGFYLSRRESSRQELERLLCRFQQHSLRLEEPVAEHDLEIEFLYLAIQEIGWDYVKRPNAPREYGQLRALGSYGWFRNTLESRDQLEPIIEDLRVRIQRLQSTLFPDEIDNVTNVQAAPPDLVLTPEQRLKAVLAPANAPFGSVHPYVNQSALNWVTDERNWQKAYVMACLSELVYLKMSKFELRGKDRYKIIPSSALQLLLEQEVEFDVERFLRSSAELNITTGETGAVVFGIFEFLHFTVIAVRGTMMWVDDFLKDFDDRRISRDDHIYHSGFLKETENARAELEARVPADRPVYFTGHSLGAAIACLLPLLWQGRQQLMTPYTFGCPRIGNATVANETPSFAYVRGPDPVPHLPPRISGFESSGWPPTVLPVGESWISGWTVMRHLAGGLAAHNIGQYRKLVGEECGASYFAADVYLRALEKALANR